MFANNTTNLSLLLIHKIKQMTIIPKMKSNVILAASAVALLFSACKPKNKSLTTGQEYNSPKWGGFADPKYKGQETGSGLVLIEGGAYVMGNTESDLQYDNNNVERTVTVHSFYMDETEISNKQYREFVYWLMRVYNPNVGVGRAKEMSYAGKSLGVDELVYTKVLPDTNCWRSKLGYNEPFVEYYFRHPAYKDYPVVGVNWHQATEFAKWRTDRVNEMILDREKIIRFDVANGTLQQDPFHNFNTRSYLAGQDAGIFSGVDESGQVIASKPSKTNMIGKKPLKDYSKSKKKDQKRYKVTMEDGILLPDYRLPTEAEWEYAAKANIGETQFDNIEQNKIYSWNDYTIRIKEGKEKNRGMIRMNVMRAKGDNAGLAGGNLNDAGIITTPVFSYWPNAYGLYNMNGNVSEWVMDVYRPLSLEDMDAFMPFRGNKFETVRLDPNGTNGIQDKDELGRLVYEDVVATKIKEGGRRNYSQADNIGYKDVQKGITEADLSYEYGVSSLINDKARVIKGGNWTDRAYFATPGTRRFLDQDQRTSYLGFRCAMIRVGSPVGNSKKGYNKLSSSGENKKTKRRKKAQ